MKEIQINHFVSLCRDDVPMVRRVAYQHLGTLLFNVVKTRGISSITKDAQGNSLVGSTLLPLYEELAVNDQDSVRLQTTENCVAFGNAMTSLVEQKQKQKQKQKGGDPESVDLEEIGILPLMERVLPLVVASIDDRSWRVRWTAASKFADVVKAFSKLPGALDSLVAAYEKLLQDPEAEVSFHFHFISFKKINHQSLQY